jgi:hypothetical protein
MMYLQISEHISAFAQIELMVRYWLMMQAM